MSVDCVSPFDWLVYLIMLLIVVSFTDVSIGVVVIRIVLFIVMSDFVISFWLKVSRIGLSA